MHNITWGDVGVIRHQYVILYDEISIIGLIFKILSHDNRKIQISYNIIRIFIILIKVLINLVIFIILISNVFQ